MTYDDYDYYNYWENWDDPLASDGPCPWGGLGNYNLLQHSCEFQCPFRKTCMKIKKQGEIERQGEMWRKLFVVECEK